MPFFGGKKRRREDPFNQGARDPFDDFFGDFSRIQEMMNEMMKNAFSGPILDEEELKKMAGKPMVYGFSMRVGPDGKPVFEQFGNVKPEEKQISTEREPLVDVIEKEKEITVIAELPGVDKKEISLSLSKDNSSLSIRVPNKFSKRLELPAAVKPDVSKAKYNNGVLEVNLGKERSSKPPRSQIPIE
ncbi:Hsp20/alpha crystallin family protein [Candidatus Micrarchaeota archaeon]|nr:Hsp20/alpha crystallin family protein [Candidatus Micrarchaeota archaeon]